MGVYIHSREKILLKKQLTLPSHLPGKHLDWCRMSRVHDVFVWRGGAYYLAEDWFGSLALRMRDAASSPEPFNATSLQLDRFNVGHSECAKRIA